MASPMIGTSRTTFALRRTRFGEIVERRSNAATVREAILDAEILKPKTDVPWKGPFAEFDLYDNPMGLLTIDL